MKLAPFQVVTLMQILECSPSGWWGGAGLLGQAIVKLEPHYKFGNEGAAALGEILSQIRGEAQRLQLRASLAQVNRIGDYIDDGTVAQDKLRSMLVDLHQRLIDDLEDRFFIMIPAENIPLYRQREPLFGKDVEAKFPEMSEDISEAGRCVALNRATAAVFHLMRIMEIAVQRFGDKLGVPLAIEKNWQNILDEVNKAIKSLDPKASQTIAYAGAAAHLYNVKVKWRNPTMHPKQTYTVEEAQDVFSAVNTFTRDLSGIL